MGSLEEGSIIAGKYKLERILAQGGMGSVWVARHLQLDVAVAVKLMAPTFAASSEGRVRFEREAKASARLKSPHAVTVHDYGVEGETPYIVMELLEGEDLDARLKREGRISPAATLTIVTQACKALRDLHGIGLVHRDLKPGNIFLARHGGEESVKILDFGIAKATGPILAGEATKTGTLLGTPYYMSPEQVRRSKDVDWRSDLWSLGVIIFRCLTGRLPFVGEELGDLFIEICTDPIPIASEIAPELGPEVDRFLARALAREPAKRFQSADELAGALAAAVELGSKQPAPVSLSSAVTLAAAPLPPHPAGSPAVGGFESTALAPSAPLAPLANAGTLGPSGHSVAEAPRRPNWIGLALAALGGASVVVISAITILRSSGPEDAAAPGSAASAPAEATAPSAPNSASVTASGSAPASASVTAPVAAPEDASAPASAPAAASASATASASAQPEPPKRTPQTKRPRKDDPRDHM